MSTQTAESPREMSGVVPRTIPLAPFDAVCAVLCASILVNVLSITTPITALLIYDCVLPNGTLPTLAVLILCAGGIVIIDAALRFSRVAIMTRAGTRYDHAQREVLMQRFITRANLPDPGRSVTQLTESLSAISVVREFRFMLLQAIVDIPFGLGFIVLIAIIGGWLALIPATLCAVFAICVLAISALNARVSAEMRASTGRQNDFIGRVFDNMLMLRAIAGELPMTDRFVRHQVETSFNLRRQVFATLVSRDVNVLFSQALIASVVVASALAAIGGNLTLGGLAACTLLAGRSLEPLQTGLLIITQYRQNKLALVEIGDALAGNEAEEKLAPPNSRPFWSGPPDIEIRNLSVVHLGGGPARPLDNLSIDIAGGEFVTITADRGAGKTTLARALLRLAPLDGTVRMGGVDVTAENIDLVRRNITFIPRDPMLPSGRLIDILTDGDENSYADVRCPLPDASHRSRRGRKTLVGGLRHRDQAEDARPFPTVFANLSRSFAASPRSARFSSSMRLRSRSTLGVSRTSGGF
ncbi:ATP-binding cassette domain-containing protein [Breoghania sp.]|uniref:ATP-binding cassette domain-containing protein n=1 Tax=Breoghania sp. TaxID=2065378 RepID=UPI002633DC04|nr:ATP-binding cassette domain-containing protein [Breoghania sp.]MDJ0933321.1 ATP-binding cassette domain-containing protein [Breoghania sp.]